MSQTIRSLAALFLLIIFGFSSTPKSVIHNIFANHKDQHYGLSKGKSESVGTSVINCHAEDLVVNVPFLSFHFEDLQPPVSLVREIKSSLVYHFFQQHHFYSELRGPPAFA